MGWQGDYTPPVDPPPDPVGPQIIQHKGAALNNTTTLTVTLDAPATAGNELWAIASFSRGSTNLDPGPAGFTEFQGDANGSGCNQKIYKMVAAGGETTVTFTAALGTSLIAAAVYEINGAVGDPSWVQLQGTLVNALAEGPIDATGLVIAAVSLAPGVDGAVGDFDSGFTTDEKQVTAAAASNIGLVTGHLNADTGSVTPTVAWAGTAVNATGFALSFTDGTAPTPSSGVTARVQEVQFDVVLKVKVDGVWTEFTFSAPTPAP
jgi:hypothetical protein